MDRDAALAALCQAHQFPGPYRFRIIGDSAPAFLARVVQVATWVLGPTQKPEVTTRTSAGGRHQSIGLTVQVASADQVLDIYRGLQGLSGVRFLL